MIKIISGGQTGVDRAALDAAMALDIPVGGYCPTGRLAEDGPIPDKYPLVEYGGRKYPPRTRRNIEESDGTLIITMQPLMRCGRGTKLTLKLASELGKPHSLLTLSDKERFTKYAKTVAAWIRKKNIAVLNVAGTRASKEPRIYESAFKLITLVLKGLIDGDDAQANECNSQDS